MSTDCDADLRAQIEVKAAAQAEASIYSLRNTYLSPTEKMEVELWFQFPGNFSLVVMLALLAYSAYRPLTWYAIIGLPIGVNVVVGVVNWALYSRSLLLWLHLTVLHKFTLWGLTLVTTVILCMDGLYWRAVFAFALTLFLSPLFEPHMFIYSVLAAKYNLHPKYLFFRQHYGKRFPFEDAAEKEIL